MAHMVKYATTEAGLVRVLDRRIGRWSRAAGTEGAEAEEVSAAVAEARQAARAVARALVQSGVVDDAVFAGSRARSLTRAGRSRRAVGAHLAAKGVGQADIQTALPEPESELASALAYARRRRLGPFRLGEADEDTRRRELGALARAGFPQPVAQAALRMGVEEATALVMALKGG